MAFFISDLKICDSDDEEGYETAPGSSDDSDEEMESPDEGPELFIYEYVFYECFEISFPRLSHLSLLF